MARILPPEALRTFLQRAAGYSLTGDTSERVLLIAHGAGRNGKSTLLEALRHVLGDYAMRTPTETLMVKREGAIPNDIARLRGARFVTAVESEENRRLAEALIKDLTGGDTIVARFMRREFFEFVPQFKLWLATNHKPIIRGTDPAIWDRIRRVPFEVRIPDDEQDKGLMAKLRAEAAGILRWAVDGCRAWRRDGLQTPEEVAAATEAYREEMDVLGAFVTDACITGEHLQDTTKRLYGAYVCWCEANAEKPRSKRSFALALAERGYVQTRSGTARGWRGIQLASDAVTDGDAETGLSLSRARESSSYEKRRHHVSSVTPDGRGGGHDDVEKGGVL